MHATALWDRVYAAVEFHRKPEDRDPAETLHRLAAKCLKVERSILLSSQTHDVRSLTLDAETTAKLEVFHPGTSPRHVSDPIIVLCHDGRFVVLDGNNRVNIWRQGAQTTLLSALMIVPRTTSKGRES